MSTYHKGSFSQSGAGYSVPSSLQFATVYVVFWPWSRFSESALKDLRNPHLLHTSGNDEEKSAAEKNAIAFTMFPFGCPCCQSGAVVENGK